MAPSGASPRDLGTGGVAAVQHCSLAAGRDARHLRGGFDRYTAAGAFSNLFNPPPPEPEPAMLAGAIELMVERASNRSALSGILL